MTSTAMEGRVGTLAVDDVRRADGRWDHNDLPDETPSIHFTGTADAMPEVPMPPWILALVAALQRMPEGGPPKVGGPSVEGAVPAGLRSSARRWGKLSVQEPGMAYGLEGEKVRLVPLDSERHLANALAWMNDPEVTAWTLIGDFPIARLAEAEFFQRVERADPFGGGTDVVLAIETLQGEHVGFTGLHRIDLRHGSAATGLIVGRKDRWGQGLATDAVRVRTHYAFQVLGLRLLLSEALDGNVASIRMLERAGYRRVGRIPRRYFKRGSYRDALLFALERGAGDG